MSSRLNPYLTLPGNAREAMEFYRSVFGGTLTLSTFGEFGATDPAMADKIMHAQLETDAGYTLMASDPGPGMGTPSGSNITVSISGDDADAQRGYFAKLAADGTVTMPLEKQMWGDEFGQLIDRFGIAWMINVTERA